jgi:hypothetical protein
MSATANERDTEMIAARDCADRLAEGIRRSAQSAGGITRLVASHGPRVEFCSLLSNHTVRSV